MAIAFALFGWMFGTPAAQDPASAGPTVALPPGLPEPAPAVIPPPPPPSTAPLLPDPAPSAGLGGFLVGSFAVLGLLGGAFLLLRRFARGTRLLGGGAIEVLARRALGPRQEVFLVDVGPRVFLIGATRDRLAPLGTFAPEEAAELRARLGAAPAEPAPRPASPVPAPPAGEDDGDPYDSLVEELAEIRKTVHAWKA
ncbi:MAG TPA: flagellar biosynthetic protein FliO [Planctomycetota bacterium]|nr:flagellar biosynthetic protein FliO [Planctomycetota bacterium]